MASTRLPSTWVRISPSHWLAVMCDAIGWAASGLWAGLIDGGSGIFGDSVPARYFTGAAAVGLRSRRCREPLPTGCVRLCSSRNSRFLFERFRSTEWIYFLSSFQPSFFLVLKVPSALTSAHGIFPLTYLRPRQASVHVAFGNTLFCTLGGKKRTPAKIITRFMQLTLLGEYSHAFDGREDGLGFIVTGVERTSLNAAFDS